MPSSQIQANIMNGQSGTIINKAPPPNKLPPPPPPPPQPPPPLPRPKTTRLPPPPPPRNSSQLLNQTNTPINPLCAPNNLNISTGSTTHILNNGSSINSLNSAGRCSYTQSLGGGVPNTNNHNQRSFMSKHGDTCSSRSSVSSHSSSLQHHHHSNNLNNNNNNNSTIGSFNNTFNHQSNLGCSCSNSNIQHNHVNSSSLSDCGSCNHSQENRNFPQGGCFAPTNNNSHHVHNITMSKCQVPNINSNSSSGVRIYNNGSSTTATTTTISRNALLYNPENIELDATSNGCDSEQNRGHCQSIHPHHHHHHHHNMHNIPMSSSSSLSSLQPVDPNVSSSPFYRCNMPQSNVAATTSGVVSDQIERPSVINHCNHLHRTNVCGHHHPSNFCEHHLPTATTAVQQQVSNNCINYLHTHNNPAHQDCNSSSLIRKNCSISNQQHRCPPELLPINQSLDASQNDSLVSTAHTHNLSNSSTTTHTSNVAVKHQPQFHRPVLSRGARSNSSQQYEYGPSSAASTSSATASLSSYQTPSSYDDRIPLYPSSKIHQPLPPPPPPTSSRSRPLTPQMLISNSSNVHDSSNLQILTNNLAPPSSQFLQLQQQQQNQLNINQTIPTLPPKPTSPNPSSHSTQITTLRASPSLQNQPITRVTSQAGVQNPLPNSDVPPPLPPLYPGSRTQPIGNTNTLMNRMPNISDIPLNPIPSFVNLNLDRTNSTATSAERKTEALTRQIEFELEQQQKSGEPYGICPKCGDKVMPAQDACKAMDQIYHAACFVCCECNRTLRGKTFYPVGDKVYCEEDFNYTGHMQSLEKCAACTQPIFDMILPAMGNSYHPRCFKCCICGQCLDGVPFTIDMKNKIYCVHDYHSIYSPKCAACGKSISPIDGTGETVRVVSMDKDYHIDCYCCEDCGLQLTDEEPSQSYPLDNHLLCQQCHINRLNKKSSLN